MKYWFRAALVSALALVPMSAAAQTAAPAQAKTSTPSMNLWYVGANTGIAVVEHVGGVFGAEAGARVWKNLDLVGELTWMQDVVTRRTLDNASKVANYLQTTQGKPASSDVEVPAFYLGAGARWVFEQTSLGGFKPYLIATLGGTHTDIKSTFTLGGTDVTNSLPQYGVTLGSDLAGTSNNFTISSGVGVVRAFSGSWYADAGVRLVSIGTQDQWTNVTRLVVGGGYKF
jgi:hypothetical protein